MNRFKNMIGLAMLSLALFTMAGCAHNLAPGGVYNGDKILYESENAINTFHDQVRDFLIWEKDNRAVLPVEVSRAADFIRLNEQKWINSANAAHDAYQKTPGDPNKKDALQLSLNLLQTALREAAAYMIASQKVAPNQGLKGVKPITLGGGGVLSPPAPAPTK